MATTTERATTEAVAAAPRPNRFLTLVRRSRITVALPALWAVLVVLLLWWTVVNLFDIPFYLLPQPVDVWHSLVNDWSRLMEEARSTVAGAMLGLGLAILVGGVIGTLMAYSPTVERILYPVVVTIRATPNIAIAPVFLIWWGFTIVPKMVVASISAFFPILINIVTGLRAGDPTVGELFQSLHAGRWETFWRFRLPNAMPYLLAGLRIAVNLAIIGAIVAELVVGGGAKGLGGIISVSAVDLRTDRVFAAAFVLMSIGVIGQLIVSFLESRLLFWHSSKLGLNKE